MGRTLPGSRIGWGHSGFHSLVTLGGSWQALSGEQLPSKTGQGPELQDCPFRQLGAGRAFPSTLHICVSCTPQGGRQLPTAPLQMGPMLNATEAH